MCDAKCLFRRATVGYSGSPLRGPIPVVMHEPNPVRVIGVGETGRRDARLVERLDEREGAGPLFLADRVVSALRLVGRVQAFEALARRRRPIRRTRCGRCRGAP